MDQTKIFDITMRAAKADPARTPGAVIRCTIEKLVYGGQGLARVARQVVFVDGVLPGEEVLARIDSIRKQCSFARPLEIISPSPRRTFPPCSMFDACGGCHWQHIDYAFQVQLKTEAVRECFARIAKMPAAPVAPAAPSPALIGYRTRARLQVTAGQTPGLGFYQRRSHARIDIVRCPVCAEPVNRAIESCRMQLHNDRAFFGTAREIDIQSSVHSGTAIISTPGRFGSRVSYVCAPPDFACRPSATPLRDTVGGMLFIRSPGSFYQGNSAQNEHMIACVIGVFDCRRHRRVLDVYCGCGNFSLFLARSGIDVTGIETHPRAVQEARANARFNKLTNCTFHADQAENISRLCSGGNVDGVLLNPPRTGCSARVLYSVCSLHPRTIAYVSCNPATLARDMAILATRGYTLKTVQPFDMFPHTYHIECIAVLHRH